MLYEVYMRKDIRYLYYLSLRANIVNLMMAFE